MAVTNYHTVNGRILGETTGGVRTDYLTDALGSVTATVNPSAQVINRYTYKPYGGLLAKTGVGADPLNQWVGSLGYRQTSKKYSDVYVRARHYDTANDRWTSKDPIGFEATDFNLFRYVKSRPLSLIDRDGLVACSCVGPDPNGGHCNSQNTPGTCPDQHYDTDAHLMQMFSAASIQAAACVGNGAIATLIGQMLACLAKGESNFDPCCRGGANGGIFQLDPTHWNDCGRGDCGPKPICDPANWNCQITVAVRLLLSSCKSGETLCFAVGQYWDVGRHDAFYQCLKEKFGVTKNAVASMKCPNKAGLSASCKCKTDWVGDVYSC
jgi:RHS repeat-associated protein